MTQIGIAQVDITPAESVWMVGYGNRDHRSEGVYQALRAGAVAIKSDSEEAVLIAADLDPGLRHDLELLPACECLPCKGVSRTDEVRPGGT